VLEHDLFLAAANGSFVRDSGVGQRRQILIDHQGHFEDRLERRIVPARQGAARGRRFELGSRYRKGLTRSVSVLAAIEAMEFVVKHAPELDHERPTADGQRLAKMEMRAF